jgi:hypothetical protein
MVPDPFIVYELAKAHQQELRRAAKLNRMAQEANAKEPTQTAFTPSRVNSWLKAIAALASSRIFSTTKAPARSSQRSAASPLNLPRLQPLKANHPPIARRADHIPCHAACAHERLN